MSESAMHAESRVGEVEPVVKKPDIVSLMWVAGLMNKQAEHAEQALVEYSHDLDRMMWSLDEDE